MAGIAPIGGSTLPSSPQTIATIGGSTSTPPPLAQGQPGPTANGDIGAVLQQLVATITQLVSALQARGGASALGGGGAPATPPPGSLAGAGPSDALGGAACTCCQKQGQVAGDSGGGQAPAQSPAQSAGGGTTAGGGQPRVERSGAIGSTAQHRASGTARIVTDANGQRRLELNGLQVENGPNLKVYLTRTNPVDGTEITEGIELGKLQSTNGNQSYAIPPGVDISQFTNAVIWCDTANTSFGVAPLSAAA